MGASFLPSWPPPANSLVLFGLILLFGLLGGRIAAATRLLPAITGYIAIGYLLGPGGLNWLTGDTLRDARLFVDISLGLVVFELGRRLDIGWMRHDPWLLVTGVLESALGYAAMFALLVTFGVDHLEAAVVSAIGVATSPAVVLIVANELRADGAVTRRTLALVAINNIASMLVLTLLLPLVRSQYNADLVSAVAQSLYIVSGSFVLGYISFQLAALIARSVGKAETPQFILTVGTILAAVGAAQLLKVSVLLTLLTFGICARNLDRRHVLMNVEFGLAGELFFVVLFVVTGATLRLQPLGTAVWLGLAIVGARYVGKALGVLALAHPSKVSLRQAALVGLGLTPMSGLAIGMLQEIYETYPEFGQHLAAVVVSGIAIMQLVGPVAARFAFRAAGETHPADAPR